MRVWAAGCGERVVEGGKGLGLPRFEGGVLAMEVSCKRFVTRALWLVACS